MGATTTLYVTDADDREVLEYDGASGATTLQVTRVGRFLRVSRLGGAMLPPYEGQDTLARLDAEGCARYVVTDVLKDGTLRGPNLGLLRDVCARTQAPVVASGGVSSLDDLRALASLVPAGVEGASVGKALYAGAFTLEEALAAVSSVSGRAVSGGR